MDSLLAGAAAGIAVDTLLFPLDTIKTRLQSNQGWNASGGIKGLYRGIGSVFVGSAPSSALFFVSYDTAKKLLHGKMSSNAQVHMISASIGETMACLIRVPVEVVKQRSQACVQSTAPNSSASSISWRTFQSVLKVDGVSGLYRGFVATLTREIPFTCIQFPLYEFLKRRHRIRHDAPFLPLHMALAYGSIAGGTAAFLTTPLDAIKTRMMLSSRVDLSIHGFVKQAGEIRAQDGWKGYWRGVVPRVMWISIGGAVFLGTYEAMINILHQQNPLR